MKKVYLETFGCQMNVSDSERIATKLETDGFEITPFEDAADVIIFNTCSVREKAEHKLFTRIGQIRKTKKNTTAKVGVTGCVAQLEGEILFNKAEGIDFVLGTRATGRVSDIINDSLEGNQKIFDIGEREEDYNWSVNDTQRNSKYVGFVPIIEGCNKFCTYCIVPFSRGREKSLPASIIIRQILDLRRQGVKEIHLIGQNVNSYRPKSDTGLEGFKGATAFSRLLRAVAATGIERIKFTTSFPRDFHPDIIDAINENENLCNWVHLPVQSGSNRVLKLMRRGHTIESYYKKIDQIRNSPRKISITTDIIVGFPGETKDDFSETVELAEYCKFDSAYIFKYSPRPGTPSFESGDSISEKEKTDRFLELENIQKRNQFNSLRQQLNLTHKVLAENKSSRSAKSLNGHTTCHKIVNFEADENLLGKILDIKITECKTNSLFGRIA